MHHHVKILWSLRTTLRAYHLSLHATLEKSWASNCPSCLTSLTHAIFFLYNNKTIQDPFLFTDANWELFPCHFEASLLQLTSGMSAPCTIQALQLIQNAAAQLVFSIPLYPIATAPPLDSCTSWIIFNIPSLNPGPLVPIVSQGTRKTCIMSLLCPGIHFWEMCFCRRQQSTSLLLIMASSKCHKCKLCQTAVITVSKMIIF